MLPVEKDVFILDGVSLLYYCCREIETYIFDISVLGWKPSNLTEIFSLDSLRKSLPEFIGKTVTQ